MKAIGVILVIMGGLLLMVNAIAPADDWATLLTALSLILTGIGFFKCINALRLYAIAYLIFIPFAVIIDQFKTWPIDCDPQGPRYEHWMSYCEAGKMQMVIDEVLSKDFAYAVLFSIVTIFILSVPKVKNRFIN